MNIKVLDCTIRDGGHLNKWNFSHSCMKASYYAALKSGIDYFEAGYQFPVSMTGFGDFAYCCDELLGSLLKVSDRCRILVMIDAGKGESGLFKENKNHSSIIKGVRIASYPYEIEKGIQLAEDIKERGYEVFLNLMAACELKKEHYELLGKWERKDILSAVYFADSFGAFLPSDVASHMQKLKAAGFERIGFHAHNNLQLAFANTLKAIDEGAAFVDASIYGMGRGSGNLPIEVLLSYLEKEGRRSYNAVPYLDVIERFYMNFFREYDWGYKIQSLLGGIVNIHPYYVENLFSRKSYTTDEICNALKLIKEKCPVSYSAEKLDEALGGRFYKPLTEEKAEKICKEINNQLKTVRAEDAPESGEKSLIGLYQGRKALVIANGPSISEYQDKILKLIPDENLVTIGVNFIPDSFIPDYHLFISRKRFLKYCGSIHKASILLVPTYFGIQFVEENYTGKYHFFELEVTERQEDPPISGSIQRCVNLNVAVCAILTAYQMGAAEILAAGMDGYVSEFTRNMVYFYNEDDVQDDKEVASIKYENLSKELERANRFLQEESVSFSIITPTSHKKYYRNILNL